MRKTAAPKDVPKDHPPSKQPESRGGAARAPVIVGAYAAAGRDLDEAAEDGLLRSVLDGPGVSGLEVPLLEGQLHRRGND